MEIENFEIFFPLSNQIKDSPQWILGFLWKLAESDAFVDGMIIELWWGNIAM